MSDLVTHSFGPSALLDTERSNGKAPSTVDVWTENLEELLQLVNRGHLRAAWESLPSLLARIESWESEYKRQSLRC